MPRPNRPALFLPALARLLNAVAEAARPRVRQSPDDWIANHVRLSDLEAAKGQYDLTGRPWWRGILEAIGDPNVRSIVMAASTQVGKTLALCAAILYLVRNAPAAALVVLPTEPDAREFRERIYALAQASGLQIPPEHKWNMRHVQIEGMRIYLAWSGSRQRMRGRRCKYVFLTEVDVYDRGRGGGDPIESARQRVKAFPRHLILVETSPIPENSRIETIEQEPERQRRRWNVQCPHCQAWQELRFFTHKDADRRGRGGFSGVFDDAGRCRDPDTVRVEAAYACENGCTISQADKAAFIGSGRWVPAGCRLDSEGNLVGTPHRPNRDLGFHLWAVHSPATWGAIAAEYAKAHRDGGIPDWWQNWFGRSFHSQGQLPTWEQLGRKLLVPYYERGQVPSDAWFLTAGCDVQEREVYAVVRAWGDAQTSWLADWFTLERKPGDENDVIKSDLAQLDAAVLDAWFPVVGGRNPRGRGQLQVALLGIDANYRGHDVHEWIRAHDKSPRLRAVRGDGNLATAERYKMSVVKESRREKDDGTGPVVYQGGMELWSIAVDAFRLLLVDRFRATSAAPGAWLLPANIMETGRHYLRQLVNEPPVYERGKDGRPRLTWREIDRTLGHDFWDAEVYAAAIAQMFVDQLPDNPGWDASRWHRPPTPQPIPTAPHIPAPAKRPIRQDRSAR
jgi:phage terminase large subunit GpA-like protein